MESIEEPLEETLRNDSCAHLNEVADIVKDSYHLVLAYYVTCIAKDALKRKAAEAFCRICGANKRIHACLECAFFGCFDETKCEEKDVDSHMKDHALKNDHYFAININHGYLFCFKCNDYVYNKIFDDICNDYKMEARRINGKHYFPYMPKEEEIVLMKNKIKKISDDSYFGLRGIVNIGEYCYVNCILQVLTHNPLMLDFFFSDKHKCFIKYPDTCLMCEMFVLLQEFYSGIEIPYDPIQFVKVLPKFNIYKPNEQEDSFEAYVDILTGLEMSCQEKHEADNCNCMVHQIFYGVNEIIRKCSCCETSSLLPLEHFVDILLDVKGDDDSLEEILRRKMQEQELISGYTCLNCKQFETTSKYTTIKKLPAVLCFQMNCFRKHESKSRSKKPQNPIYKKKSTACDFKDSIDMSEYLNSKDDVKLLDGSYASNSLGELNKYYLFAVVFHKGDGNTGHYAAYIKHRKKRWFECSDERVSAVTIEEVVKCEPYLLFYYKQL